MAETEILLIAY